MRVQRGAATAAVAATAALSRATACPAQAARADVCSTINALGTTANTGIPDREAVRRGSTATLRNAASIPIAKQIKRSNNRDPAQVIVTPSVKTPEKHASAESRPHRRPLSAGEKFAWAAMGMYGAAIVCLGWAEYKGYTVEGAWRKERERIEMEKLKNAQAHAPPSSGSNQPKRSKTTTEDSRQKQLSRRASGSA